MGILSLPGRKSRQSDIINSTLLADVFAKFQSQSCISVLDVGVGSKDTLEFLKQYPHCKVYFLDLAEHLADVNFATFKESFQKYGGALFDICLFWDLLYCLSTAQLEDLSNTLEGYIYSQTRAHSIANLNEPGERFCIRAQDQIKVVTGKPREYPLGSITSIAQHFHCLKVEADKFRGDGRLEVVLQAPV